MKFVWEREHYVTHVEKKLVLMVLGHCGAVSSHLVL